MVVNETLSCTWCGNPVDPSDGYRLAEHARDRGAVFCRLEHVVPWAMQGAHWEVGEPSGLETHTERPIERHTKRPRECAHCGQELGGAPLLLVRHRGEHRIPDAFCSVDHLLEWAKAGGRFRS